MLTNHYPAIQAGKGKRFDGILQTAMPKRLIFHFLRADLLLYLL